MRSPVPTILAVLLVSSGSAAQSKFPNRPYEPVILYGSSLRALEGVPVTEIGGYAYDASTAEWRAIPLQVDEVGPGPDAFFAPDDGLLDGQPDHPDEVVFMLRDAGDRAPTNSWPPEADAEMARVEVELTDQDGDTGFVYLFRVRGDFHSPDPYQMRYHADQDSISSLYYGVGFANTIAIKSVVIFPEHGGNGQDLVDTQKMRFKFRPPLARPFEINEQADFVTETVEAVAGPVRVIRRMTARMPSLSTTFHMTARLYPFSLVAGGGKRQFSASLNISLIRQSLDLSPNAVGMRFFNRYNDGIPIDGTPDNPNRTLDVPGYNWFMVTGEPGTIVSILDVPPLGDAQALYYWDRASGGTDDGTADTGDGKSFGDVGVKITGTKISGEYDFSNMRLYFLPPNQSAEAAEALLDQLLNPVERRLRVQQFTSVTSWREKTRPSSFKLLPVHPNPFRGTALVQVEIPQRSRVSLWVTDLRGRVVRTLVQDSWMPKGEHSFRWDGRTADGSPAASGVYLVRLEVEGRGIRTEKLLLLR